MSAKVASAILSKRNKIVQLVEVVEFNPRFGKDELARDSLVSFIPMRCVEEECGRFESLGDRKFSEVCKGYTPFRDGDVIFAKVTPCMENGKAAVLKGLTNGVGFGSTEFFALRPKSGLDANYLFHFILQSSFRRDAARNMTGAVGLRRVPKTWLEQQQIPLPEIKDQRRIVAEIEKQFTRLDAGVAALRRVQANLKRYRFAVLKAACDGKLVPTKTTWPQIQIAKAIRTMDQGWSPKCESDPSDSNATWEVIKTTAIQNLRFMEIENKKLPASLKTRPHLELQSGDLLVTRAGPRNRVGVACLVKSTRPRLMLCDKAYRLRCKPDVAAPAFLELVLNAPHVVYEVNKLKTGISDSGVNLTQKRFGELLIPLPPLAEQTRIVAEVERRLSVVEELEAVVTANLQRAARLRQSILQKAFIGELVGQETEELPANVVRLPKAAEVHAPNSHFARVLLSGEIVHRLHDEPTFGRIKHQKIFHLCEHIAQIEEIHGQYHREAAGPLDNKLIYANEAELKKQKWYQEVRRESYGHAYQALAKAGGHRKYVERYWAEKLPTIEKLIELMRKWDTDRCEIFCTAYAAWNDLVLWGKPATEENILHEILECWHDSKKRFPKDRWLKAIAWMKINGFVPTGFGKPTKILK